MQPEQQGTNIVAIIVIGALIFAAGLALLIMINNSRNLPPPTPIGQEEQIDINVEAPSPETQEPDLIPATSS